MKRLLLLLAFLCFTTAFSQTDKSKGRQKQKTTKSTVKKSAKSSENATYSKAGKSDPNEQGSGMTVPSQDKPKLDERPNPAATVPSSQNPADNRNPLPAN